LAALVAGPTRGALASAIGRAQVSRTAGGLSACLIRGDHARPGVVVT
jgi:hypothetical protein